MVGFGGRGFDVVEEGEGLEFEKGVVEDGKEDEGGR